MSEADMLAFQFVLFWFMMVTTTTPDDLAMNFSWVMA
jgi:hypothetical protein